MSSKTNSLTRLVTNFDFQATHKPTLNIGIVNLMPTVKNTEKQWRTVLSANKDVETNIIFFNSLIRPSTRVTTKYLNKNYYSWKSYDFNKLDGLIITGAPVELLEFNQVEYYSEFCQIIDKSIKHNLHLALICWAAQAGLHHLYEVNKTILDKKISGVYSHKIHNHSHPLFKNFENNLYACISRQTRVDFSQALKHTRLLLSSNIDGVDCLEDNYNSIIYMFNHLEYDLNTLENEYLRDSAKDISIPKPENYFKNNEINYCWKDDKLKFYSNWLDIILEEKFLEFSKLATA